MALPLVGLLYIVGWKRRVLSENRQRCGVSPFAFRGRFYFHAACDLLGWVHGRYERAIRVRKRDADKLKNLKSIASLFLTAHFHQWEAMGAWMTREGIPLLSAARPLASSWAQALQAGLRLRKGMAITYREIPRQALRHLERGGCFGLLWDQRVARSETQAPFFGIPLLLDPLPAFLLRHHPVPVWFGVLLPDGTFRLLPLSPSGEGRPPDPDRIARRYHRVLELLVRRHPTWWYGFAHRRFQGARSQGVFGSAPLLSGAKVSRETSGPSGVMVSRETKLSA